MSIRQWQPDPRDFHEPAKYPARQWVYRPIKERVRVGKGGHFCVHCRNVIQPGESHDGMTMAGLGSGAYRNPARLHSRCRREFIISRNAILATLHGILISLCLWCAKYLGYEDGQGQSGISSGVCGDECLDAWTKGRDDGESILAGTPCVCGKCTESVGGKGQ